MAPDRRGLWKSIPSSEDIICGLKERDRRIYPLDETPRLQQRQQIADDLFFGLARKCRCHRLDMNHVKS